MNQVSFWWLLYSSTYLIVRKINNAFDANTSLEVRGAFLFISKKIKSLAQGFII